MLSFVNKTCVSYDMAHKSYSLSSLMIQYKLVQISKFTLQIGGLDMPIRS